MRREAARGHVGSSIAPVLLAYDAHGRLATLTQAGRGWRYSYDTRSRLQVVRDTLGRMTTYGYNTADQVTSQSLPGNRTVDSVSTLANIAFRDSVQRVNGAQPASYGYDADGLLSTVAVNTTTESLTRRGGDRLLSATSVGGVTSALSYNNHGELWKLAYAWSGGSFQQVLDRDSLGRITRITESGISAHVFDYHYDAAGRLDSVAVDNAKRAGYTYDDNGNRTAWRGPTTADTATAGYDAQDRLRRYGNATYAYTADGELTRRSSAAGTLRTTYDALGNLTGAHAVNGDSLTYLVDGENRRVARVVNGTRTHTWLYRNGLNVIAELDNAGAVASRYVYGTQGHVPDLLVKGGVTYRLITDQLGSVRAVVHVSSGAVAQRMDYDAWGVATKDSVPTFQSLGYAGGLMDRSTGRLLRPHRQVWGCPKVQQ